MFPLLFVSATFPPNVLGNLNSVPLNDVGDGDS